MIKNFLSFKILSLDNKFFGNIIALMIVILSIGIVYALFISPPDHIQGDSVRIMYVHVPSSFIALGCFAFIGFASICNLIFKIKFISLMAKSSASIGLIFNLISIVTGSLWGKPTWGTWWVWDARLTSVFILFLIYMGHIAVVRAFEDEYKGARAAAILTLFGAFNLPIIKFSVDWWNTLHQPASVIKLDGPSIHVDMLIPLILMAFGFLFFYFSFLLINVQTELNHRKLKKLFINKLNLK